jgi:hypothetical protein
MSRPESCTGLAGASPVAVSRPVRHPEKTRVVELGLGGEGFDFLGCYLRVMRSHFKGRTYLFRWPSPGKVNAA